MGLLKDQEASATLTRLDTVRAATKIGGSVLLYVVWNKFNKLLPLKPSVLKPPAKAS